MPAAPDWQRLCEQALVRAETAEARVAELKSAELAARSSAATYKALFQSARRKRLEAVEDANEARRAAKNAFSLAAEVRRLNNLLADAGVASDRYSVIGLRRRDCPAARRNSWDNSFPTVLCGKVSASADGKRKNTTCTEGILFGINRASRIGILDPSATGRIASSS